MGHEADNHCLQYKPDTVINFSYPPQSPDFPSPLSGDEDELTSDLHSTISIGSMGSSRERLTLIVAPPDVFSGDESLTPTPGMEAELLENDSQVSTPRVLYEPHFTEAMTAAAEGKVRGIAH